MSEEARFIQVRGAREHNLTGIDADLPRGQITAITGPSGSGKSSLAFDTICAEGQRRYLESLSTHARQALGPLKRPAVDDIRGLSPTIAVGQRTGNPGRRSTVGTMSEVLDYLRVLFARAGTFHCPRCGGEIRAWTPGQMVEALLEQPAGSRWLLLAPLVRERPGDFTRLLLDLKSQGFVRTRIDGVIHDLEATPRLNPRKPHTIELVVDRYVRTPDHEALRARINDSVELALRLGAGVVVASSSDGSQEVRFSSRWHCEPCDRPFPTPGPNLFSFNSDLGACPACHGLGTRLSADPGKLIPDTSLSLDDGAIAHLVADPSMVTEIAATCGIDPSCPVETLGDAERERLLSGLSSVELSEASKGTHRGGFVGLARLAEQAYEAARTDSLRARLEQHLTEARCDSCGGSRFGEDARATRFLGTTIEALLTMEIRSLVRWFEGMSVPPRLAPIVNDLAREVLARLRFIVDLGVGYLSLARSGPSLSAGELQRIRLAPHLGGDLTGLTYVLDEPSLGLHPRDTLRLVTSLRRLQELGNTVLLVEHDEILIREADWVLELGPGAGVNGGRIVASGTPSGLAADAKSAMGRWLRHPPSIAADRRAQADAWIPIRGASANNLKGIDVDIPMGRLTAISGVSGSGKTSLLGEVRSSGDVQKASGTSGLEGLSRVVLIDQSPIGRSPRSNPASYVGVMDEVRHLFAATKDAKTRGYGAARFSFNAKQGRCEACRGEGHVKVELHIVADVWLACEVCQGRRYSPATLEVKYKGLDIASVLDMSIADAQEFFAAVPRIARSLGPLVAIGLGYLKLGQPSTTLSGGEVQRLKLARGLHAANADRALYLLDEPTTGLHHDDISRLLDVLQRLVNAGHTVVVVDHDLAILTAADWIIDLGPEAGPDGGQLVAAGPPELIAQLTHTHTGRYLADALARPRE